MSLRSGYLEFQEKRIKNELQISRTVLSKWIAVSISSYPLEDLDFQSRQLQQQ